MANDKQESKASSSSERYDRIVNCYEKIAAMKDKKGRGVDDNVVDIMAALVMHNFVTVASCEGHLDHGEPYPWISFQVVPTKELKTAVKKIKKMPELATDFLSEWTSRNAEQLEKMKSFLESFYTENNITNDTRLVVEKSGYGGFYLQPAGAATTNILEAGQQQIKNTAYHAEMERFANFLFAKY